MVLGFTGQRYCSDRPTIRQHQVTSLLASKQEISDVKSKWILLVEDEDSLRNAVGKFLAKEGGFNVTGVSDAQSALLVCRGLVHTTKRTPHIIINDTNSTSNSTIRVPDCVVLDIQLNGPINGLDLLKIIRADSLLENLPVILLTAKGRVEDRVLGYNSGADAYLPKPFDPVPALPLFNQSIENFLVCLIILRSSGSVNEFTRLLGSTLLRCNDSIFMILPTPGKISWFSSASEMIILFPALRISVNTSCALNNSEHTSR